MAAYTGRLSFDIPENAIEAGVLLLLQKTASDISTILIERVTHERDKHSGQISFPGGRKDLVDPDIEACALREAEEEIGVLRERVNVLGRLTDLYIPVSGFLVSPVVGLVEDQIELIPQPTEVAAVLQVPLSILFTKEIRQAKDLKIREGFVLKNVPYFEIQGKVVWGATAMMLNEFITISEEIIDWVSG